MMAIRRGSQTSLASLPAELVVHVLKYLPTRKSLHACLSSSKLLYKPYESNSKIILRCVVKTEIYELAQNSGKRSTHELAQRFVDILELASFIDELDELVWSKYKRENNFSPGAVAWAARVIEGHLKAGRSAKAYELKELVWRKCGRKRNYTAVAVLQVALDLEKHRKAGRTQQADILEQLIWSSHEDFDRKGALEWDLNSLESEIAS
jgi:hypothetical protein